MKKYLILACALAALTGCRTSSDRHGANGSTINEPAGAAANSGTDSSGATASPPRNQDLPNRQPEEPNNGGFGPYDQYEDMNYQPQNTTPGGSPGAGPGVLNEPAGAQPGPNTGAVQPWTPGTLPTSPGTIPGSPGATVPGNPGAIPGASGTVPGNPAPGTTPNTVPGANPGHPGYTPASPGAPATSGTAPSGSGTSSGTGVGSGSSGSGTSGGAGGVGGAGSGGGGGR